MISMSSFKLQSAKNNVGERYFLTLPKKTIESLGWNKGDDISVDLFVEKSDICLKLKKV